MHKFKIGEVAIIARWINHPELIGRECTILTNDIHYGKNFYEVDIEGFGTREPDGRIMAAYEDDLRKKKPPLSTWNKIEEQTNWNPMKQYEY